MKKMASNLPLSPQIARLTLADSLVECVLFKERLRLENNRFAARMKAGEFPMEEFRTYQAEEFDPRIDAVVDVRTRIEHRIIESSI